MKQFFVFTSCEILRIYKQDKVWAMDYKIDGVISTVYSRKKSYLLNPKINRFINL